MKLAHAVLGLVLLLGLLPGWRTAYAETPEVSRTAEDLITGKLRTPADREQELPPIREVQKPKESISDAFGKQYISNKVVTSFPDKIVSGKDITEFEVVEIKKVLTGAEDAAFKFDPSVPAKRRFLINERYHPGDPRLPEILKMAVDAEFGLVGQISHLDDALVVNFGSEKTVTRLNDETVKPNDGENGQVVQQLKDMGFEYATDGKLPNRFIAGPPPVRKDSPQERSDLYHQKAWIVGEMDEHGKVTRAFVLPGTANEVPHAALNEDGEKLSKFVSTRYNRAFTVVDPDLAMYHAQTAIDNAKQFSKAVPIRKLENAERLRVSFKDGWVEQGFTHGANNLNARWTAILLHAVQVQDKGGMRPLTQAEVEAGFDKDVAGAFKDYKLLSGWVPGEYWSSDFVQTHTPSLLKAEKMLYEQYPHLRGKSHGNNAKVGNSFKLVDAKFATDPTGWGLVTPQNGVSLQRSMGGTVFPWSASIAPDTYVYVRGTGAPELEEDGPPVARHLQHDKTGGAAGTLNGKPVAFMRTGSFNYSNAEGNAEEQRIFGEIDPEGWIYKGTRESVQSIVKSEPQFAIPFKSAMRMADVARLTGRGLLEVPREVADTISEHVDFGEFAKAKERLMVLAGKPTNLEEKVAKEELEARVNRLGAYLEWHHKNYPNLYGERDASGNVKREPSPYLIRLSNIVVLLTKDLSPANKAFELRSVVWFPNSTDEQREARAAEAWKLLGFEGEIPQRSDRAGSPKVATMDSGDHVAASSPKSVAAEEVAEASAEAVGEKADCKKAAKKVAPRTSRTTRSRTRKPNT